MFTPHTPGTDPATLSPKIGDFGLSALVVQKMDDAMELSRQAEVVRKLLIEQELAEEVALGGGAEGAQAGGGTERPVGPSPPSGLTIESSQGASPTPFSPPMMVEVKPLLR